MDSGFAVTEYVGAHDVESCYGIRALNHKRMVLAVKDDRGS